ncbi:MAG: hypothetical protein P4M00_09275 [Azospirillaceae bacterium]|nr:hypothetical protein [Azospirillaceae bacterium]
MIAKIAKSLLLGMLALTAASVAGGSALAQTACALSQASNSIHHVVVLQFDNVHLLRDRAAVPSDLEQIPSLLNFLTGKGVLSNNDHTDIISHTGAGFLSTLTGLYPDRMGMGTTNSFRYFNADGTSTSASAFGYWTDPVSATRSTPLMVDERGKNTPAPWVTYTRAGCDVGMAGFANTVLENTGRDVSTVFGASSVEAQEAAANSTLAAADFVGIAVHCAKSSPLCAGSSNAKSDLLPDEPGGYTGFNALFGHKYVAPAITASLPLQNLFGNTIVDMSGNAGFPGFDGMVPSTSLAYVATMLEAGIPVVYGYLSDAHDRHFTSTAQAYGPGEALYVSQLKAYDAGFSAFFARLKADGIDETNTLFVVTQDEGDHFVGGAGSPAGCDGTVTPCTYTQIGEINADLSRLLATQRGNTTPFAVHADSAPTVYITGNPAQTDAVTRTLERDMLALTVTNPMTNTSGSLVDAAIDQTAQYLVHMGSSDTARMPTFAIFQDENYYSSASGQTTSCTTGTACVQQLPSYAYNHGDVQNDIRTTFLGMVGPGVRQLGLTGAVWSDHTDVRPTIMALLGLTDDYVGDGRVLVEYLSPAALPIEAALNYDSLVGLGQAFKTINAPFGMLSLTAIAAMTDGLRGTDQTYSEIQNQIAALTTQRNALVSRIKVAVNAPFRGADVVPQELDLLTQEADSLLFAGYNFYQ